MTTTTVIDMYAIEKRLALLCTQKRACQEKDLSSEIYEARICMLRTIRGEVKKDAKAIMEYCSEVGVIDRTCAQLFDRIMHEL